MLIWQVVDDEQLDDVVPDVAARLVRSSPDAMNRVRTAITEAAHNNLDEQLDLERDHQRVLIPHNR